MKTREQENRKFKIEQDLRKNSHAEFISASSAILKQVQNDKKCVTPNRNKEIGELKFG